MKAICELVLALMFVAPAHGQLGERNQLGLRMGHIHLMVRDIDAHKRFWTTLMGGRLVRNGALELVEFPGVYIILTQVDTPARPSGSIVDHFGFIVNDMPTVLERWKAAGVEIDPTENPNEVYVIAPDQVRVEVYGEPAVPTPIAMNHIHYYPVDIAAIKAWYVAVLGANPGRRPCVACISKPRMIQSADLPQVNLSFSQADSQALPTQGGVIDHIGFDLEDLDSFVDMLEARGIQVDGAARQLPGTTVKSVFLTDPWGTRIELTEGLAPR
jgi:catechol 2,3-dioxygenase-like lactoylglutathione lyase family enzyme